MRSISRREFIGIAAGIAAGTGLALAGCSGSSSTQTATSSSQAASSSASGAISQAASNSAFETSSSSGSQDTAKGKSVIVLWSWSGNTLRMAERVSELSGAEIYRIEAADPYPEDYDATADRAKQERDDGVCPAIANPIENWEDYDTVFMGYPIWWYELPMIVQGFVNDHDWSGKTIIPFNSHEGSGDGGTYDDLREMTGATVLDGIAIRGGDVASSLDRIDEWYASLPLQSA